MKQDNGRNILSNAILAIILVLVGFGVIGAHLKISELKETNTKLRKEVDELKQNLIYVESHNEKLTLWAWDVINVTGELKEKIATLKKEIRKLDKKHAAEIEKTAATLANVEKDITELRELIKRHADNLAGLKENTQAAFGGNNENLSVIVAKMNEIIDFANDASKKMEKLEMDLNDLKNKRTCPLPPWKKRK